MEGLDGEGAGAGFGVDVAEGAEGDSAGRFEGVPETVAIFFAGELELKCVEEFRRDGFEFKGSAVINAAAALNFIAALAFEFGGEQTALLRERVGSAGGDFGEKHSLVAPGDDVAGGGDVDFGPVTSALNRYRFEGIEKFGVK